MKTSAGMRKTVNPGMAIVGVLSIFCTQRSCTLRTD
jgi:hypothetical protein